MVSMGVHKVSHAVYSCPMSEHYQPMVQGVMFSWSAAHVTWCFSTPSPAWGPVHPGQGMFSSRGTDPAVFRTPGPQDPRTSGPQDTGHRTWMLCVGILSISSHGVFQHHTSWRRAAERSINTCIACPVLVHVAVQFVSCAGRVARAAPLVDHTVFFNTIHHGGALQSAVKILALLDVSHVLV